MNEIYNQTMTREKYLRNRVNDVKVIWECQFDLMIRTCPELAEFVNNIDVPERLKIRDAFFGGRVNAIKLHYEVKEGEKIFY